MQYFWSLILYILSLSTLCVVGYIIFDGAALDIALVSICIGWTVLYLYLDKLVLVYLSAREVIDTDEQQLFQDIKNEVYKTSIKKPNVYLYNGNSKNCFALDSRGDWSVVLEKSMLKGLSSDQLKYLVEFLFHFKASGKPHLQTKIMGMSSLIFLTIYWLVKHLLVLLMFVAFSFSYILTLAFLENQSYFAPLIVLLFFFSGMLFYYRRKGSLYLSKDSRLFRALSLFLISLVRPILLLFQFFSRRKFKIPANNCLKPIVMEASYRNYSLDKFLVDHLQTDVRLKEMILEYIEGFPLLEFCHFNEDEY